MVELTSGQLPSYGVGSSGYEGNGENGGNYGGYDGTNGGTIGQKKLKYIEKKKNIMY